jgi:hypothetical protein
MLTGPGHHSPKCDRSPILYRGRFAQLRNIPKLLGIECTGMDVFGKIHRIRGDHLRQGNRDRSAICISSLSRL